MICEMIVLCREEATVHYYLQSGKTLSSAGTTDDVGCYAVVFYAIEPTELPSSWAAKDKRVQLVTSSKKAAL